MRFQSLCAAACCAISAAMTRAMAHTRRVVAPRLARIIAPLYAPARFPELTAAVSSGTKAVLEAHVLGCDEPLDSLSVRNVYSEHLQDERVIEGRVAIRNPSNDGAPSHGYSRVAWRKFDVRFRSRPKPVQVRSTSHEYTREGLSDETADCYGIGGG